MKGARGERDRRRLKEELKRYMKEDK